MGTLAKDFSKISSGSIKYGENICTAGDIRVGYAISRSPDLYTIIGKYSDGKLLPLELKGEM